MNILLFTVAAGVCLMIIWILAQGKDLEQRHFKLLCTTGAPSYLLGLGFMGWTDQTGDLSVSSVIAIALACFGALSYMFFMRMKNISSREFTLMVLWGQVTFPLVILALPTLLQLHS